MELNDWSAFMITAEQNLKTIEDNLLHKKYSNIHNNIAIIKDALDKTQAWVVMQGSDANVDVVDALRRILTATPDTDFARSYLVAAIQEIEQLRGERKFWLQAGYRIGSTSE